MKRLALLLLVVPLASPSSAGESAQAEAVPVRLTLDDAIARARDTSARLASFTALARAASEGVRGAGAGRRPDLDVSAGYTRNSNVPELVLAIPGSPPRTLFPNLPDNWRTHAGARFPLYTGGRVGSEITAATEMERAALSDRAAAGNDLVAETHIAYVNVLFARENVRVLTEALASYESHLKDARHRQELGLAASNETLAVMVEREQAELARLQSENGAAVAMANLLRLVGLPPGTAVELDPAPEASGSSREGVEDLVKRAAAGRPELEALRARIRSLEATQKVARSGSRPQAGLEAGWDYTNPNLRYVPWEAKFRSAWSVGVGVSWKILDGGRSGASAAQAQAQADALRAQLSDLESRIRLDVTTRRLELDTALAGRAVARRGIEAGRDGLRVARDRYKEGVLSSSDLLDAETRLLRAELDVSLTEARIQVAAANLTRAVGR
ncbi:MAG TPA: TolC family protein [Vicinamibacteria bacterium]|nr:TolC family protein [Vicinamibacteria bacterium]HRB12919.1 TolC family protein [Vicinamibacteria bacterium]